MEGYVATPAQQAGLLDTLQPKPATAFFPEERTIAALRQAAASCTACPLYKNATQTVFGAGPEGARAMFVGEQPGDQEDLAGKPFVGPAGEVLARALAEAGIPREEVYITNAVKHFKWEPRGKRRIHQTPRAPELEACRPWLEAEIEAVAPAVLVCLGATAAQALMGPQIRIMRDRGTVFPSRWAPWMMATVHPSSILRADPGAPQERAYAEFVADMRKVAARLNEVRAG
jgi:DNA polymerase